MSYLNSQSVNFTERSLLKKWNKLHARLERKLQNKSFYQLISQKQHQLVGKLKRCYAQLNKVGISLKHTAVAGSMALALVMGNTSHAQTFVEQTGMANPLSAVDLGDFNRTSFVDIDGDGDLDMFTEDENAMYIYSIRYFQNTGTSTSPTFAEQTGMNNPFNGVTQADYAFTHAFVDIDGDGDMDVFVNEYDGNTYEYSIKYYQNTGSAMSPTFAKQMAMSNPLSAFSSDYEPTVTFADLDGDGDMDAVIANENSTTGFLRYYENTGSKMSATFTERTGMMNPLDGITTGSSAGTWVPADLDMDNDSDFFLIFDDGNMGVGFDYYLNSGATPPTFAKQMESANPFDGLMVGDNPSPIFADMDGDGDDDAFFLDTDGKFKYFRNDGTAMSIFDPQGNETNDRLSDFYPNPSQNGLVNLNYTAEGFGQVEVSVFDRAGKVLNTQTQEVISGNNQLSFDFSTLATGLYLVRFEEAGKAAFRKLVIE
ncbi:MAG: T9SS type A sorting domain-containing protein [Bacteroidota bacterium]